MGKQIFVKNLAGATFTIDIEPSDTVLDMKKKIYLKTGIAHFYQRLEREWWFPDNSLMAYKCVSVGRFT